MCTGAPPVPQREVPTLWGRSGNTAEGPQQLIQASGVWQWIGMSWFLSSEIILQYKCMVKAHLKYQIVICCYTNRLSILLLSLIAAIQKWVSCLEGKFIGEGSQNMRALAPGFPAFFKLGLVRVKAIEDGVIKQLKHIIGYHFFKIIWVNVA